MTLAKLPSGKDIVIILQWIKTLGRHQSEMERLKQQEQLIANYRAAGAEQVYLDVIVLEGIYTVDGARKRFGELNAESRLTVLLVASPTDRDRDRNPELPEATDIPRGGIGSSG